MRLMGLVLTMGVIAAPAAGEPENARTLVDQANRDFADGAYEKAMKGYSAAEVTKPESPELAYNQALVQYKLNNFDAARSMFNKALATRDLSLEGKVKYNLGNTAYASALEKLSNLSEAIESLKTAIGHYRDALEIAPDDKDAKANIETAQLLIKDLFDKRKQQQEQQQENQDQENQQEQDQEQQDQQQPQDQQGEQEQSEDQKQPEQQDPQGQQQDQQDPSQQEQAQPQQQDERKMTREEAERLLQAVRDKERQRREANARRLRAKRLPVLKDW